MKFYSKEQELNYKLARAIGWKHELLEVPPRLHCLILRTETPWGRSFSFREWNVMGPIAEKYDLFPYKDAKGNWRCHSSKGYCTPQEAIAQAVVDYYSMAVL